MAQARTILIADPDVDAARLLSRALREKGYQVHYAQDGSRALEVAVLRHPDLTLFDEACPILDARSFIQILGTNPRTEDMPVVLTTTRLDAERFAGLRDGTLHKPFNVNEVLSRIEQIVRRSEAARELKSRSQNIEGSLSQLAISDLLQILAMNQRTGRLRVTRGKERAEVELLDGKPKNAKLGEVDGEKAFFRMLTWQEGNFSFLSGTGPTRELIQRNMDSALLEGARQADELGRILSQLPPRARRVFLTRPAEEVGEESSTLAQVARLLANPIVLSEVFDQVAAPDLEVAAALKTLESRGQLGVAEEEGQSETAPFLGPAEIHALRSRLFRGQAPNRIAVAKVFLCAERPEAGRRVLALPGVVATAAQPPALTSSFGTVGRYELNETFKVDFLLLPTAEAARPLWRPFTPGSVGALLLDTSEYAVRLATYLAWEVRIPLAVVGPEVPHVLLGAPSGVWTVGDDPPEGIRSLLVWASTPVQPALGKSRSGGAPSIASATPASS